jgi:hypothetical protein
VVGQWRSDSLRVVPRWWSGDRVHGRSRAFTVVRAGVWPAEMNDSGPLRIPTSCPGIVRRRGARALYLQVSKGDLGTEKWEPSHQRRRRWERGAVCAAFYRIRT